MIFNESTLFRDYNNIHTATPTTNALTTFIDTAAPEYKYAGTGILGVVCITVVLVVPEGVVVVVPEGVVVVVPEGVVVVVPEGVVVVVPEGVVVVVWFPVVEFVLLLLMQYGRLCVGIEKVIANGFAKDTGGCPCIVVTQSVVFVVF